MKCSMPVNHLLRHRTLNIVTTALLQRPAAEIIFYLDGKAGDSAYFLLKYSNISVVIL
jgi:hypothetical protein